jgi:hypothetical protein
MSEEKKVDAPEKREVEKLETTPKNEMLIEAKSKEGRIFRFCMPFGAPLTESYDAGVSILNEIANIFNKAIEEQKKESAAKKEADVKIED